MTIEASVQQPTPAENEPFDLVWTGGAEPPERLIDFGPDGAGGYPVVEVAEASDEAALHLAGHACVDPPVALDLGRVPLADEWRVEVDPLVYLHPLGVGERHALVSLAEHLHERARGGVPVSSLSGPGRRMYGWSMR